MPEKPLLQSGRTKTVIGMLHLAPLAGAPLNRDSMSRLRETVLADAAALVEGGVHALMMENFGDVPFFPGRVPAHVVAQMTALAAEVRRAHPNVSLGINILRNDGRSALAVAHAVGASFIRVNVLCGARVTDQGVIQGIAHDLLRDRAMLGASDVKILADVDVKHSAPLAPRELEDEVDDVLKRGLADAIVASGAGTGKPTDPGKLQRIKRAAGGTPVFVGSGVTAQGLAELAPHCDGFIVGTAFKKDGKATNPVELARVKELVSRGFDVMHLDAGRIGAISLFQLSISQGRRFVEHDLVIPNFHVVLVHLPLGMLVAGTLIELFSFLWRQSGFRRAGQWMLLIGALSAIPAATSGMFAAKQALSSEEETSWHEISNSTRLSPPEWEMLRDHVRLNAGAVILFAVLVLAWMGASDRMRSRLYFAFLVLLLAGNGLIVAGAWHGGELVYRFGVGVEQRENKQLAMPATAPSTAPSTVESTHSHDAGSTAGESSIRQRIEHIVPPIQAHLILAGWVVALGLAALGLSIRQITMRPHPEGDEALVDRQLEDALQPGRALARDANFSVERARASLLNESDVTPPLVPPARFWLVTALLALATAALGLWTAGILQPDQILAYVKDPQNTRGQAHAIIGVSIVVLSVILAMITRWAGRSKVAVAIFGVLLLCALGAQVWMGILLFFDGMTGPLARFN